MRWRLRGAPGLPPEPPKRSDFEVALSTTPPSPVLAAQRITNRAVDNPLVRGGLTLVAGVITGNIVGFGRVALTAHLLGTQSRADSLAVAMGPIDTLNSVLINSIVFAFVPMLTACESEERIALFRKLARGFLWISSAIALAVMLAAPWLMRALAPGLNAESFDVAVNLLRILSASSAAAGAAAVQCALLYTDRRFAPTAFYQAALNACTIVSALVFWKALGVYAFALGYGAGAWVQLGVVWFATRKNVRHVAATSSSVQWREILARPAFFVVYAAGLGLNIVFTRAYATHAGPGMAAALDYCMRGVGVPLAIMVNPISNSLLPEIARLRSLLRIREAIRLIDRTVGLAALGAATACGFALLFREPAIALLFQHGKFTAESTRMVSAAFLGLGPSLLGWTLIEITARSLFALERPWPPVIAIAIPVLLNMAITVRLTPSHPALVGLGASVGLFAGFLVLFAIMHASRGRWLTPPAVR